MGDVGPNPVVRIGDTIVFGLKLKARMLELGRRAGRVPCPREHADGNQHFVRAVLAGPKNHIHMACDDPACIRLME